MSTLTLASLTHVAADAGVGEAAIVPDIRKVERFEAALARQAEGPPAAAALAHVAPVGAKAEAAAADGATSNLPGEPGAGMTDPLVTRAVTGRGDMILEGFKVLRTEFDAREARVHTMMAANSTSANDLIALQMEVANFSLLVDLTSKLVGKSTQTFDTLMKGQ